MEDSFATVPAGPDPVSVAEIRFAVSTDPGPSAGFNVPTWTTPGVTSTAGFDGGAAGCEVFTSSKPLDGSATGWLRATVFPVTAAGLGGSTLGASGSITKGAAGGSAGEGPASGARVVGITIASLARNSTTSRYGVASWDVVTSASPWRSSTTRVTPGRVSATRMRFRNLS